MVASVDLAMRRIPHVVVRAAKPLVRLTAWQMQLDSRTTIPQILQKPFIYDEREMMRPNSCHSLQSEVSIRRIQYEHLLARLQTSSFRGRMMFLLSFGAIGSKA